MIKTAIVGAGFMGGTHIVCHKLSSFVQPVAVVEVREDLAREKLKNFELDLPVYTDMEEMIKNEHPDLVDIATPTFTHKELAVKAMELGCNVLCEKPMALTTEDCREMIEASRRTGKKLMVAHVVRFMAPYMYLKHTVDTGRLGKLLRLNMARNSSTPNWSWENWMTDRARSGGEIVDLSVHDIDFVNYLLGRPDNISCVHYTMKDETEFSSVNFTYENTSVSIEGGWYSASIPFKAGFTAYFEKGLIEFNGTGIIENGNNIEITDETEAILIDGKPYAKDDGYRKEIEYFADCIENGREPEIVLPESSADTIALCLEILGKAENI